jgi:hypothetical protein
MAQGTIKIVTQQGSRVAMVEDADTNQQFPIKDGHFDGDAMQDGQSVSFDAEHQVGGSLALNLRPND